MNKLDKHCLSRWFRRICQTTQPDKDSRQSSTYIKVQPPVIELVTDKDPIYENERGVSPSPIRVKVKVDNVRWKEARTSEGINSNELVYKVVHTSEGGMEVRFGDGVEGARLPSGTDDISATYRIGGEGHLVYLDVWERDVGSTEDPEIIERGLTTDPDLAVPLIELLALAGDMLTEYQDTLANEAQLDTTRRRPSLKHHSALLKELRGEVDHLNHLLTGIEGRKSNLV